MVGTQMRRSLTIGIVGAGGDGVVVLGSLLQRIGAALGYFSQMPRYYGAQIRGGGSAVKLRLDAERLSLPKDSLDIFVCFSWERYLEFKQEMALREDTLVTCENDAPEEMKLAKRCFRIDFSRRSQQITGSTQSKNIVALGLLKAILALPDIRVRGIIAEDKELKLLKENLPTLEAGEGLFREYSLPELTLSPARDPSAKVVLHGNAAMARAASEAECHSFFGYPITPAAEIMEEMQRELSRKKGVFLQAEDEIASVGLAVGASLAGAKSMTSTSGPGFDLMTEMIGLASADEIPVVIIDVQRCGPSTGIPSKSEQSDLNHAIYGGHGDAPSVVIAPYDVKGCYRLVIESFNIAECFQTPVILLSDQWLGQTFVAIDDEFLREYHPVKGRKKPSNEDIKDYHRYQLTEDLISPMAVAGDEGFTYQATGLTHNDKGAPAFDHETHQKLHEKRRNKLAPLRQRDDLAQVFGKGETSKGVITWGSSAQIVIDTVRNLGLQNEITVCVPELIHPLPEKIERFAGSMEKLLVVEMNYSGQLYRYLRSRIDLPRRTEVCSRAGGQPFSTEELTEPIRELAR